MKSSWPLAREPEDKRIPTMHSMHQALYTDANAKKCRVHHYYFHSSWHENSFELGYPIMRQKCLHFLSILVGYDLKFYGVFQRWLIICDAVREKGTRPQHREGGCRNSNHRVLRNKTLSLSLPHFRNLCNYFWWWFLKSRWILRIIMFIYQLFHTRALTKYIFW